MRRNLFFRFALNDKPISSSCEPVAHPVQGHRSHQRLAFIDKLRVIANGTNDENLLRKAEELDRLAFEILNKKFSSQQALMEKAKAAEVALEEKRTWGNSASASNSGGGPIRLAPNGRPLPTQE